MSCVYLPLKTYGNAAFAILMGREGMFVQCHYVLNNWIFHYITWVSYSGKEAVSRVDTVLLIVAGNNQDLMPEDTVDIAVLLEEHIILHPSRNWLIFFTAITQTNTKHSKNAFRQIQNHFRHWKFMDFKQDVLLL